MKCMYVYICKCICMSYVCICGRRCGVGKLIRISGVEAQAIYAATALSPAKHFSLLPLESRC